MTDEELRRLIAAMAGDPDHEHSYLRMPDLAPVLRDALRFRWLNDSKGDYGLDDFCWVEWRGRGASIRAAIDAGMEAIEG